MEVLHRRCAGLDVHKKTVVACIRIAEGGKVKREVREFGTATRALYALAEWLTECGCSHAAMESTGVYWKPVWHVLEDANLKLSNVVTDILGVSGRAVLDAVIQGETDPGVLMELTSPRLKASREEVAEALYGRVTAHHRFMLRLHLNQIDGVNGAVVTVDAQTEELLEPFRGTVDHLLTMPGIGPTVAAVLVAEIGTDMSRFKTPGHLVSWAGLCPRLDESAGKARSTRTRHGHWLKTTLVQAAWAAVRKKDNYLHAQFLRIKRRRGAKRAIIAVAASMLSAAYHMIRDDADYQDLGGDYFLRYDREKVARRLVRRLRELGLEVEVRQAA